MTLRNAIIPALALPFIVIAMISGVSATDDNPEVIYDDHVVYNLNNLADKGTYTVKSNGNAYEFNTTQSAAGWYYSTITSTVGGESSTVEFSFYLNDDGTYTLVADDKGINNRFASALNDAGTRSHLQDPPKLISKDASDQGTTATDLYDRETQWCGFWTDEWIVESDTSDYIGKVFVEWEGESAFNYYCLFPYNIYSVSINYEGQIRNTVSGSDNFDEGTSPYILSGWWQYSSAS